MYILHRKNDEVVLKPCNLLYYIDQTGTSRIADLSNFSKVKTHKLNQALCVNQARRRRFMERTRSTLDIEPISVQKEFTVAIFGFNQRDLNHHEDLLAFVEDVKNLYQNPVELANYEFYAKQCQDVYLKIDPIRQAYGFTNTFFEGGRVPNLHPIPYLYLSNGNFVRVSNPLPTKYFKKVNITKALGTSPSEEDLNNFVKRMLLKYIPNNEGKSGSLITSLPKYKQKTIKEINDRVYEQLRSTIDPVPLENNEYVVTFDRQLYKPFVLWVRNFNWDKGSTNIDLDSLDITTTCNGCIGKANFTSVELIKDKLKELVKLPSPKFKNKVIKTVRFTSRAITIQFTDGCVLEQTRNYKCRWKEA